MSKVISILIFFCETYIGGMFGQLYQLDFTSAGLPRDEDITISFELPDGEESPELTNKFLDWVFAKGVFPDSDYTFYAPDNERLKAVKKAAINLREKEKAAKKRSSS